MLCKVWNIWLGKIRKFLFKFWFSMNSSHHLPSRTLNINNNLKRLDIFITISDVKSSCNYVAIVRFPFTTKQIVFVGRVCFDVVKLLSLPVLIVKISNKRRRKIHYRFEDFGPKCVDFTFILPLSLWRTLNILNGNFPDCQTFKKFYFHQRKCGDWERWRSVGY